MEMCGLVRILKAARSLNLCVLKNSISLNSTRNFATVNYDSDYYVQTSILPTNHFLKSLPRLPIPELEKTCDRYLAAQRVLLDDEKFYQTEKLVNAFKSEGQDLQKELKDIDARNKHTSYISTDWTNKYLEDRNSIVLNHNPFISFEDDPKTDYNKTLIRATNLVVSSLKFMNTYNANMLEPEMFHLNPQKSDTEFFRRFVRMLPRSISWYGAYLYNVFPLDMANFPWLFNSTRIPREKRDILNNEKYDAGHLVVLRNGNFYVFDVIDKGKIIPAIEILAHLQYVLQLNDPPSKCPLGCLTSEKRDVWAGVRELLIDAGNLEALDAIDTSIFALVFDDGEPEDVNSLIRQLLHGFGHNRWFDKSFQLIFTKNGQCAVNFEHSWGDGIAILRYINETYNDSCQNPSVHPDTQAASVDSSSVVRRLEFNLTDSIRASVDKAKRDFDHIVGHLQVDHMNFQDKRFNRSYLKSKKLSPDSVMQLIIQLAFYRQHGHFASTYESCSTAAFRRGRTEVIRPATMATKSACELILNPSSAQSIAQLQESISLCSHHHSRLTKEALMGNGFDRHLWALKLLSEKKGKLPDIFKDPSYREITHDYISTSTLESPAIKLGGFGPPVHDGFAVGYGVGEDKMGFVVSSYAVRDTRELILSLNASTEDIFNILEGILPKNK